MIQFSGNYDAHDDHIRNTPNIQIMEVNTATGSSTTSVAGVYRSPGSALAEDGELFLFFILVAASAGKLLKLGYFNAPEIDWAYETTTEGNFGR